MIQIRITVRTDEGKVSLTDTDGDVTIDEWDIPPIIDTDKLWEALDKIKEAVK